MEPGIYHDLPFEEYVAIQAWNASALKRLSLSPRAAKYGVAEPESLAMKGGKYAHMAVLEPDKFNESVAIMPRFHGGMNDASAVAKGYDGGKQAKASWVEAHSDREIVEGSVRDEALGIASAVHACAPAKAMLTSGKSEVTIVWDDPTGVRCKARLDHLLENNRGGYSIVDLKKTGSVRQESFEREIDRLRMHLQAALYLRGLSIVNDDPYDPLDFGQPYVFVWAAFESRSPHYCRLYQFADPHREAATVEVERMLRVVAHCESAGVWPDYSDRIYSIGQSDHYKPYQYPEGIQIDE